MEEKKGTHALVWDEAQKVAGKDPDFHRRDLFESIENGDYPEFELGVQIIDEKDEHKFPFDLLDPKKIIPEELVPVQLIGKMVLDRNPDNFSLKQSKSHSVRPTSCRVLILQTILCFKEDFFHIKTLS